MKPAKRQPYPIIVKVSTADGKKTLSNRHALLMNVRSILSIDEVIIPHHRLGSWVLRNSAYSATAIATRLAKITGNPIGPAQIVAALTKIGFKKASENSEIIAKHKEQ